MLPLVMDRLVVRIRCALPMEIAPAFAVPVVHHTAVARLTTSRMSILVFKCQSLCRRWIAI